MQSGQNPPHSEIPPGKISTKGLNLSDIKESGYSSKYSFKISGTAQTEWPGHNVSIWQGKALHNIRENSHLFPFRLYK